MAGVTGIACLNNINDVVSQTHSEKPLGTKRLSGTPTNLDLGAPENATAAKRLAPLSDPGRPMTLTA